MSFYHVMARRAWIVAVAIGATSAMAVVAMKVIAPVFEASGQVQVLGREAGGMEGALASLALPGANGPGLESAVLIFRSDTVVDQVIRQVGLKDPVTQDFLSVEAFLAAGKVATVRGSNIVRFAVEHKDPIMAAQVVDTWMEVARLDNMQTNREGASGTAAYIGDQLGKARAALAKSEKALLDYRRAKGTVDVGQETSGSLRDVQDLENQLIETRANGVDAEAQASSLRSRLGLSAQDALVLSSLAQNRTIARLREDLLQLEMAPVGQGLTPDHPRVIQRQAQIDQLRKRIVAEAAAIVGPRLARSPVASELDPLRQRMAQDLIEAEIKAMGLRTRQQTLQRALADSRARLSRLPEQEIQISRLTRDVRLHAEQVQTLTARQAEARLAEARNVPNLRVIQYARVSDHPVRPNKLHLLVQALLGGLLLGGVLAALAEHFDNRIFTAEELAEAAEPHGVPSLLTTIPFSKPRRGAPLAVLDPEEGIAAERYRIARSRIKRLVEKDGVKSLVVTSAIPAEGKSTFSANLAVTLAQAGMRVLLVDADMRRPSLAAAFGVEPGAGFAAVLAGERLASESVVESGVANLWLLPSVPTPHPSELLESVAFDEFVASAEARYDMVLFDAPPMIGLPDAGKLALGTDGTVVVAGIGKVHRREFAEALERLREVGAPLAGLVAQGARLPRREYHYYDMYYGSRRPGLLARLVGGARPGRAPSPSEPSA